MWAPTITMYKRGGNMLWNMPGKPWRPIAAVTAMLALIMLASAAPSAAENDMSIKRPPSDYGVFGPGAKRFPAAGGGYKDPVFETTVRRITDEYGDGTSPQPSNSDIYSKNGFWSADGKLMFHNTMTGKTIVNAATGALVASVEGEHDYKGFDGSFAPDDAPGEYRWYYLSGSMLRQYVITEAGVKSESLVKDFKELRARKLGLLGGSVDWIDNSGQKMVLNLDGKIRVWNNETKMLYSGSVGAAGADWIGISPNGNYVVTSTDKGFYSYAVNHDRGTLSTKGILFWTLCGGHGDLVTASDGQTFLVTFDCYGEASPPYNMPAVYAVHVAPAASVSGRTEASRTAQRETVPNKRLFQLTWAESGDGHVAGVSRGLLQDWAFVSLESNQPDDVFGRSVDDGDWWDRPYMQEIVMTNVLTGEVRRLAHHRSRSVINSYYYQPRVSAGWGSCDGPATVAWASNFGRETGWDAETGSFRYADIYAIDVAATDEEVTAAKDKDICP
jgi:hypothetical protein